MKDSLKIEKRFFIKMYKKLTGTSFNNVGFYLMFVNSKAFITM